MVKNRIVITRCVKRSLNTVTHNSAVLDKLCKEFSIRNGQAVIFIGMDGTRARLVCVIHNVPMLLLFPTDSRLSTRHLLAELVIAWVTKAAIESTAKADFIYLMPVKKAAA